MRDSRYYAVSGSKVDATTVHDSAVIEKIYKKKKGKRKGKGIILVPCKRSVAFSPSPNERKYAWGVAIIGLPPFPPLSMVTILSTLFIEMAGSLAMAPHVI